MTGTIEEFAKRSKRTFDADGLIDMAIGVSLLGIAALLYVGIKTAEAAGTPQSYSFFSASNVFIYSIFAVNALIVASFHGVNYLKNRVVYPRVGYSAPRTLPQPARRKWTLVMIVACMLLSAITSQTRYGGAIVAFWTGQAHTIVIGILFAAAMLYQFLRLGFARHLIAATLAIVITGILATSTASGISSYAVLASVLGIFMLVAGAIPFMELLRLPVLSDSGLED